MSLAGTPLACSANDSAMVATDAASARTSSVVSSPSRSSTESSTASGLPFLVRVNRSCWAWATRASSFRRAFASLTDRVVGLDSSPQPAPWPALAHANPRSPPALKISFDGHIVGTNVRYSSLVHDVDRQGATHWPAGTSPSGSVRHLPAPGGDPQPRSLDKAGWAQSGHHARTAGNTRAPGAGPHTSAPTGTA